MKTYFWASTHFGDCQNANFLNILWLFRRCVLTFKTRAAGVFFARTGIGIESNSETTRGLGDERGPSWRASDGAICFRNLSRSSCGTCKDWHAFPHPFSILPRNVRWPPGQTAKLATEETCSTHRKWSMSHWTCAEPHTYLGSSSEEVYQSWTNAWHA